MTAMNTHAILIESRILIAAIIKGPRLFLSCTSHVPLTVSRGYFSDKFLTCEV